MVAAALWLAWLLCATHAAQHDRERAAEKARRSGLPQTSGCLATFRTGATVRGW